MTADRFWEILCPSGECWLWPLSKDGGGYGQCSIDGVIWKAHRFAFADTNGGIPPGLSVLHKCDTPACCNPAHLYAGTTRDNRLDATERGRWISPRRFFTAELVLEIRTAVLAGERSCDVAARYDVPRSVISKLIHGTHYRLISRQLTKRDLRAGRIVKLERQK